MIEKNREYETTITGMTHEGQGVAKIDGFTIFVDDALVSEKVKILIVKVNKTYGIGKLVQVIEPSADRVEPFCSIYKRCGGCNLQHLGYDGQKKFKEDQVQEALKRIGKLDIKVNEIIGMEEPLKYRNKVQFPVGLVNGNLVSGFYAKRSHEIIEGDECGIQTGTSNKIRCIVKKFILDKGISVYDEKSGEGLVRHIVVRTSFSTGEVMVVLVLNGRGIRFGNELVEGLISEVPEVMSVYININDKNTNVIMGEESKLMYGKETIRDQIGDYSFEISPLSFYQVNPVQTKVLYEKALEYAGLSGTETVFDLYCGIGTISLFLSKTAGKVYGVEVVEDAVKDARRNAELNGVKNVEFVVGEAEKVVSEIGVKADVVVVDPPRKGCEEGLLETIVEMGPKRVVYVSCNPATLARDLKYLTENGFGVKEVQPVDMFPWTSHVECVVLIERKGLGE